MTRFYRDENGKYLGGFDGGEPLLGAFEVPVPPDDARQIWDGQAWSWPLETLQSDLRAKINSIRDEKICAGLAYDFPDGVLGTIDSAEQRDFDNLQALTTLAQELRDGGETAAVLTFVEKEDQAHALTPQQMIDAGLALTYFVTGIYAASWVHKNAVKEAASLAELQAIDLRAGWP